MFKISVIIDFSSAHQLRNYEGKCENIHGHNWKVEALVTGSKLNEAGMLIDFKCLKDMVNQLDHEDINLVMHPLNPTAENISRYLAEKIQGILPEETFVSKVTVQESEGNVACYIP